MIRGVNWRAPALPRGVWLFELPALRKVAGPGQAEPAQKAGLWLEQYGNASVSLRRWGATFRLAHPFPSEKGVRTRSFFRQETAARMVR